MHTIKKYEEEKKNFRKNHNVISLPFLKLDLFLFDLNTLKIISYFFFRTLDVSICEEGINKYQMHTQARKHPDCVLDFAFY